MDTTIIIPCVRRSIFLETTTIPAIKRHTPSEVPIVIAHEPDLNVSECRQKWMDLAETRYVYFMDVDSVMLHDDWLPILHDVMEEYQAGAVTPAEVWGGKKLGKHPFRQRNHVCDSQHISGAGCLYDTSVGAHWDPFLGETYGYIGREFEDVDFCRCIKSKGKQCYITDKAYFEHAWHNEDNLKTDEALLWRIVWQLIKWKWLLPPEKREHFFRLLHPIATRKFEKNHDLPGISRSEAVHWIFGDLISYWGGDIDAFVAWTEGERSADDVFPHGHYGGNAITTPEERGVEDIWSKRYEEVKPRSPK